MNLDLTHAELRALDYLFFNSLIEFPKDSIYCKERDLMRIMHKVSRAMGMPDSYVLAVKKQTRKRKRGAK